MVRFNEWRRTATAKDWLTQLGVVLGLMIIASSLFLAWRVYAEKNEQVDSLRDRARSAEARQARSEGRADLAEERLDETLRVARSEREFYRQLECEDIAAINRFIGITSGLILAGEAELTPEQEEALTVFTQPRTPPIPCDEEE